MSALYPPVKRMGSPPEPDMEYVFHEMKKKNVTLLVLWEEYKEKHPDGIMYTQFCDRYRKFKKLNNISLRKEHKTGKEIEVDWAGTTMSYMDPPTWKEQTADIFVAVLPASGYSFVYAYRDMTPCPAGFMPMYGPFNIMAAFSGSQFRNMFPGTYSRSTSRGTPPTY